MEIDQIGGQFDMKNLKVSKKLLLSFSIVIAMTVAIVVTGIVGMTTLLKDYNEFYNSPFQNVQLLKEMSKSMNSSSKNMIQSAIETDTTMINERLALADSDIANLTETVKQVRNTFTDSKLIDEIQTSLNDIGTSIDKFTELCKANLSEEAYAYYKSDLMDKFQNANSKINTAIDIATTQAKNLYDEGIKTSNVVIVIGVVVGVAGVVMGIVLSIYLTKSITTGLKDVQNAAKNICNGNFKIDIKYTSKDEIGELAENMRMMCKETITVIKDIDRCFEELSKGNLNLSNDSAALYIGEYSQINKNQVALVDKLNTIMADINQSAEQVASGSEQVAAGAQALASGATEQASSVEELAATIQVVAGQIHQNAEAAKSASSKTNETVEAMHSANTKMEELVKAMEEIKERSGQISQIIKTIEDIAFQTNILSLNAAIEAARAGEAGKGFAVVADEVRNLASKSGEAANNTNELIESTVRAVEQGNGLVSEVAAMMEQVAASSGEVQKLNSSISDASAEAADSIVQIDTGVEQISNVVQTNSATAEESAAASEELSGQAVTLKELISEFKLREA